MDKEVCLLNDMKDVIDLLIRCYRFTYKIL